MTNKPPLFVIVTTRNVADPDEPPQRQRINYHNPKARHWLGQHSWWALHHGYAIHTEADTCSD